MDLDDPQPRLKMRINSFALAAPIALLLSFAPLSVSPLQAQTGTLSGIVTDETGTPVAQAQLSVLGTGSNTGTLTDNQGVYRITLPAGTYDVSVTHVAHANTRAENVRITAGQTTTLNIEVASKVMALTGIVVSGSRTQVGERVIEQAATSDVITSTEISERSTFNSADHLRSAPGVDVITTGLQNSNVVVRGFNNIFSGSLHMLSDYRLAGVPSLRVNLMHFIPTTDEDIERMEVVLGPGSALYGPNTANGVVHIISKSPLNSQGTTVTLGTGMKSSSSPSAYQGTFRTAFLATPELGFKFSGQYLSAEEWEYNDPAEIEGQTFADLNPGLCVADKMTRGLSSAESTIACDRIGDRDFDIQRWSFEARADWQFAEDGLFVGTFGRNNSSGIELTGLGAGQTADWVYDFFQGRFSLGRLFAQAYYNTSNSGDSFLLRDGVNLVDDSSLKVAQIQHGVALADGRQDFTYGFDHFSTDPVSSGRIYGTYEDDNNMTEWGAYVQSKTAVTEKVDLIFAGRLDSHSVLPDNVFSPRAAVVFKPTENHGIRLTYNSAFSTPSALNYFLDIGGGFAPAPLGGLGFTTRAYGSGRNGWSLRGPDGTFEWVRSPLTPATSGGASQLIPADVSILWQYYVGVLQASGGIDAGTAGFLASQTPTNADILRLAIDPNTQDASLLTSLDLQDMSATLESNTKTFELGWTGVLNNRISVSADVYYTRKDDFVSPLMVETPLVSLDPATMEAYLTPIVGPTSAAQIAAGAGTVGDPVPIPLGVVSSEDVGAQGADLILAYRNVGDIDLWGGDIAFQAFLTDEWVLSGTLSHVSDDEFPITGGAPISLNSPADKGSVGLAYRGLESGLSTSARMRFTSGFPASSAGFAGDVESSSIVDFTAGYKVPNTAATLQLSVTNLFNSAYQSFVGVPAVGRFTMLRVKYDLF